MDAFRFCEARMIAAMPRKPNYQFERQERERLKAAKAAEKAALKREQKEREKPTPESEPQ
jgi:hypothetical protein